MFYTSLRNLLAFQIVASQFLSKFELNFHLICFLGKVAGFCILRIVKIIHFNIFVEEEGYHISLSFDGPGFTSL